jgi:RNA polymerase sigma factor (sigma-70 family)
MYTVKGKADKNHLLTEHMPLVKRLAHQMKAKLPPSVEVDDLIQAGMIGLLDAINRYEENHGAQFETYAVLRIRGAMLDELRSNDWMPRSTRQNMRKVEQAMCPRPHPAPPPPPPNHGRVSSIVPMVPHVDHTEHDVDIIVTEHGLADLRALAPRERAEAIIAQCVATPYRKMLRAYVAEARQRGGQTPHVLEKAYAWHERYRLTGSMLENAA